MLLDGIPGEPEVRVESIWLSCAVTMIVAMVRPSAIPPCSRLRALSTRQLLPAIDDYVDGTLDIALPECQEFAANLAEANPCPVVIATIRQTSALSKAGELYPLPQEFQAGSWVSGAVWWARNGSERCAKKLGKAAY